MYQRNYLLLLLLLAVCHGLCAQQVIPVSRYGIRPDTRADMSPRIQKMLKDLRKRTAQGEEVVLQFAPGRYDFHPDRAAERTYYISNHDQDNPKRVGIPLEGLKNVTLDGGGASFVFHGRMLPLSLLESEGCTLKNFSIDFENPHIAQVRILSADTLNGVVFRPEPWVQWRLTPDSVFEAYGEGWTVRHSWGVVFEDSTKRLVYNSGDRACPTQGARLTDGGDIHAPRWKDAVLKPGMRFVMRGWGRPTPGIFLYKDKDTRLENIRIHYAEGMGVLAQVCEDITLDRLSVCLKGKDDPRSFTTQADATHFSGCKGVISSCGGLYEGMMDDAINVHGTYLKVVQRIDDHTLVGRYMHDQSWGFHWGDPGDSVQFIRAHTMEPAGTANRIVSIRPHDRETEDGAREFRITFRDAIAPEIGTQDAYGIENLTWTPQVRFAGNTVRNNRARGALFSTPRRTVAEDNLFDHTSGTAILLCGDCNGWYETGACRDVLIRRNRFVNALTSLYQFTNAVISIYPEIPELERQQQYFHGGQGRGIVIEDNEFDLFDAPLLYAKSVDGLWFRRNVIRRNTDYPPFHFNRDTFRLERVTNAHLSL